MLSKVLVETKDICIRARFPRRLSVVWPIAGSSTLLGRLNFPHVQGRFRFNLRSFVVLGVFGVVGSGSKVAQFGG